MSRATLENIRVNTDIVKGVKSALKEVELIESGKKHPKSIDQLLNEL